MTMDEKKLPRWAQDALLKLRNRNAELERQLAIATRSAPENGATGKVVADDLGQGGFPLDDRASVTFTLPHGKIRCGLRDNGTVLNINADGTLLVLPNASNDIKVKAIPTGNIIWGGTYAQSPPCGGF